MIHTHKHCPHCGKLYETSSSYADHLGSPIRTCLNCGQHFIDKAYKEPGFYDPPAPFAFWKLLVGALWPFGIGAIILLVAAFYIGHISALILPIAPLAAYLYLVYNGYKKRDVIYQDKLSEYKASRERLKNKNYVMLLLDNGCFVPRYFLTVHHQDLLHYAPKKGTLPKNKDSSYIT